MSRKKIYFISFVTVALLCLWAFLWSLWVTKDIRKDIETGNSQEQKLNVDGLVITETKDGKVYWEMYAQKGRYESDKGIAVLEDIVGNFYKDEKVSMSFESSKGTYRESSKQITLYNGTHIVAKDGSSIRADKMVWSGQDEDIIATGNIKVERNSAILAKSDRAVFNNNLTYFRIEGNTKLEVFEPGEKK